ncbi:MAG: hypothetical protein ACIAS6_14975 [Phycisphaerales bacterium JB060]
MAFLLIALCLGSRVDAGVRVVSPDGQLIIHAETLPDALESGQWSLLVWVYAQETVSEPNSMLEIGGRLAITVDPDGVLVRLAHRGEAATFRFAETLRAGHRHLLAVSMDARSRNARAWLAIDQGPPVEADIRSLAATLRPQGGARGLSQRPREGALPSMGQRTPARSTSISRRSARVRDALLSPDRHDLVLGASLHGLPAARMVYDALAIRSHPLVTADIRAVWASRSYDSGHSLDAQGDGGRMNGWNGCAFLTLHGVSSAANGPGLPEDKTSYVGGPVLASNVMIVPRPREMVPAQSHAFRTVVPVHSARGMVYSSYLEPDLHGFFDTKPTPFDAPTVPIGPLGEKASMLVTGPRGLVRVMVSANSRGVRGSLWPQPWPEGFAHGFVQALLPQVAGVMMRPPTILDRRGGWLGLDTTDSEPETSLVRPLHTRSDAWGDWTRFGSGTLPANSRGSGPAVSVSPEGEYRLRCGPVDGSLLRADAPLVVRSTLLAFPGSSTLRWEPERGHMQDGPGHPTGPLETVPLDTTRVSTTMLAGDAIVGQTLLVLGRVVDAREGDAIVVMDGPARGAVSVVSSVNVDTGVTAITLSHPFGEKPEPGARLHIGPWRFVSVEHRFTSVPPGDDRTWRGQVLRAADDDLLGLMVYGISAWRPDVDGFIFGSAGQSGQGYTPQLDSAFPGSLEAWAQASQADVWIQGLAQQSSQPSAMWAYTRVLRDGLGDQAEIIWASDGVHAHTTHDRWHLYLDQTAADAGVPAIFAVGDPRVGSYFAQAASGMRADDAHYSSFGSRVIAEVWLDQLRILADGTCGVADFNRDGLADLFDLLAFQMAWQDGDPSADLDGDGEFLIFDFLILLAAIDQCQ